MIKQELERNTYNFRFKRAKKEQNRLKEAFFSIVGVSLLAVVYLIVNGLVWAIENLVK